ncbi:unnamed protein product [Pipistrellus nathusii]|uniref:Uncharacterized protein n=1 Tax=Pipistrellus nathusii TaxID=59473 RepID=A0ABP0A4Q8_PIPNA
MNLASIMISFMSSKMCDKTEGFSTLLTFIRFSPSMCSSMISKRLGESESFTTFIELFSIVCAFMLGICRRQPIDVSLTSVLLSAFLTSTLSMEKYLQVRIKGEKRTGIVKGFSTILTGHGLFSV